MLTRLLTNLLYAVKPTDPLTFFVVLLVLICAAMLAVTFPPVARLAPILRSLYDMNKFAA